MEFVFWPTNIHKGNMDLISKFWARVTLGVMCRNDTMRRTTPYEERARISLCLEEAKMKSNMFCPIPFIIYQATNLLKWKQWFGKT